METSKRAQILEGVWAVIAEHGLEAVSVRSVAAAAGVSPGRVQHYFASRSALVRASAEEMIAQAARAHPQALGDPADPATLWSLLTHSLDPADAARSGVAVYFSYVAAAVADPQIAQILADARRGAAEAVRRCLAEQHPGLPDPDALALELLLLAEGATQAVLLGWASRDDARATIRRALDRIGAPQG